MNPRETRDTASPGGRMLDLRTYFTETIWGAQPAGVGVGQAVLRGLARYVYLIVRGFRDDQCLLRSQALTFMSLLVLVPLLALAFSLAKGFGLQNALREEFIERLAVAQQDMVHRIIAYVDRTDVTALGAFGLLVLIFTSVSVLGNIEKSFNDIWGVSGNRSFLRKFSNYLSVLLIWPVLLIASTGVTASLTSNGIVSRILAYPVVSVTMQMFVRLVPILTICAALTFIYIFMPNTRVRFYSGLVGGLVAGAIWHLVQWAYIHFQVGVAQYNAIYGTFASIPIFLLWLDVSWIIVLLGSEIAYSVQHADTYHPPLPQGFLSIARRERAALRFLARVWERFAEGARPLTAGDLAAEINLPHPASHEIVESLVRCGLIARAAAPQDALLPNRDLGGMSIGEMLIAFRHQGEAGHEVAGSDALGERIGALQRRLEEAIRAEGKLGLGDALKAEGGS